MANIKKGDLVQVISGRSQARGGDRGKQGRVIEVQVERTNGGPPSAPPPVHAGAGIGATIP